MICARHAGRRVRFTTLAAVANELRGAELRPGAAGSIGGYSRTALVCLYKLGYLDS